MIHKCKRCDTETELSSANWPWMPECSMCPKCDSTYCKDEEKDMEWKDVNVELPKEEKHYLAYGEIQDALTFYYNGFFQVSYTRTVGWQRSEKIDNRAFKVFYWSELPEIPHDLLKKKFPSK